GAIAADEARYGLGLILGQTGAVAADQAGTVAADQAGTVAADQADAMLADNLGRLVGLRLADNALLDRVLKPRRAKHQRRALSAQRALAYQPREHLLRRRR